mgnify:CR=1 FL=1
MNQDNILTLERDVPAAAAPANVGSVVDAGEAYPLDWEQTTIDLGKGRKLTLRRPTQAEILARDAELPDRQGRQLCSAGPDAQ